MLLGPEPIGPLAGNCGATVQATQARTKVSLNCLSQPRPHRRPRTPASEPSLRHNERFFFSYDASRSSVEAGSIKALDADGHLSGHSTPLLSTRLARVCLLIQEVGNAVVLKQHAPGHGDAGDVPTLFQPRARHPSLPIAVARQLYQVGILPVIGVPSGTLPVEEGSIRPSSSTIMFRGAMSPCVKMDLSDRGSRLGRSLPSA